MTTTDQDVRLVERSATGDAAAFAELYDRHSAAIFGLLLKMLGRDSEAEEILQETFLQAWQQAERYRRERAAPRGWLLMIARSRALDSLRSRNASRRREQNAVEERVVAGGTTAPEAPDHVEHRERWKLVSEAMRELSSEQRECIELAYFDGLTQRQIAEHTGAPLGTVKSRILLGMNKLRAAMAPFR